MSNAVMPLSDYKNTCDKIREKTASTDNIKSGELANKVNEVYEKGKQELANVVTNGGTRASYLFNKCTTFTSLPMVDTSNATDFTRMFGECWVLKTVPEVDTSKGTNFTLMFSDCWVMPTIPKLDTSKGTNFTQMFFNCKALKALPKLNLSSGTKFTYMIYNCHALTTTPELNTSSGTEFTEMFYNDYSLHTISKINLSSGTILANMFLNCSELKNIVFEGSINVSLSFSSCAKLTLESAISAITHLKDYSADTTKAYKYTITFSSATLTLLHAEGNASPNGTTWLEYIDSLGWNCS